MVQDGRYEAFFSSDDALDHQLIIHISNGEVLTNEDILEESFELTESLCTGNVLDFGNCEASAIKIRLSNPFTDYTGLTATVYMAINTDVLEAITDGTENITDEIGEVLESSDGMFQIGIYKIKSDIPSMDRSYHDLIAYDSMYDILNTDVTSWYSSLIWDGMTVGKLRKSLLNYLGIPYKDNQYINDNILVKNNVDSSSITGNNIINSICQLNGGFGHINRLGQFVIIQLESDIDKTYDRYIEGTGSYQNYETIPIDGVRILGKDTVTIADDNPKNIYTFSNILTSGMEASILTTVASNILSIIRGITFRPFNVSTYGDYCVEVGDHISIPTANIDIDSYVLHRNIKGIQALRDVLTADSDKSYTADSNGLYAQLEGIKDTAVVKTTPEGSLVLCPVGADSSVGEDLKIQARNIAFISDGNLDLTSQKMSITSEHFTVTPDGRIYATEGKFGMFDIDGDKGGGFKAVAGGADIEYRLIMEFDTSPSYPTGMTPVFKIQTVQNGILYNKLYMTVDGELHAEKINGKSIHWESLNIGGKIYNVLVGD